MMFCEKIKKSYLFLLIPENNKFQQMLALSESVPKPPPKSGGDFPHEIKLCIYNYCIIKHIKS